MPTRITGLPAVVAGATRGVEASSPPNILQFKNTDPTTTDYFNFNTGDLWLHSNPDIPSKGLPANSVYRLWMLVAKVQQTATWIMISGGNGSVVSLTGNTGGPVFPLLGNINTVGDGVGITVAGNPGTHTLTWSLVGGGQAIQAIHPDVGANIVPVAGVIDYFAQPTCGSTVTTSNGGGAGNILRLNVTDGNQNTLIGLNSGNLTQTSFGSTALGYSALLNLTSGQQNTALGNGAGLNVTTGQQNTVVGAGALQTSTTGSYNTGIGSQALFHLTSGTLNTCGGYLSGTAITTGTLHVALGSGALQSNTTGNSNTAIGSNALTTSTTGSGNTAVGNGAAAAVTTGSSNVSIGQVAHQALTTGSFNIALGGAAGNAYTTAESSNISIGNVGVLGESNVIRIGTQGAGNNQQNAAYMAGIYNTAIGATNAIVFVDNTGKLGTMGTNSYATGTFTPTMTFSTSTGTITYSTQVAKYTLIGNVFNFILTIQVTSIGTSSGNMIINGFPFAAVGAAGLALDVNAQTSGSLTYPAGRTYAFASMSGSTAVMFAAGSNVATANFTDASVGGTFTITLDGFYFTS